MAATKLRLVFFVSLAVLVPSLQANIGEFDEFWQQREAEAKKAALEAYQPNPELITEQFNSKVNE